MICDKSLQLDAGLSFASFNAGTKYCTNWIDLGAAGKKLADAPMWLIVRVGTAFTDGTSATFHIMTSAKAASDTAGTGLDSNVYVELSSPTVLEAALTANTIVWKVKMPDNYTYRYLGLKTVTVGNHTTGTIDVDIVTDIPRA